MTGEIRNPVKLPTDLNPAEERFAACLATGELCRIGNGELPKKRIQSGKGANVVRSEVIRFFAYGGNEENPVSGSMICLWGAWISEDLDLMHASIPYALYFSNCHFDASVMMQCAECITLYLNGSRLTKGLNADGLTTKGVVHLCEGFSAEGEVRLLGASIGGNLSCTGGKFHNPGGNALNVDGLTTTGSVNLRKGFSAEGEVRLLGASIGGYLSCTGGKFHNPGGNALNVDGLTMAGGVQLRDGFSAEGEVRFLIANIGGDFDCEGGEFHNSNGDALSADRLTATGGIYLRGGFSAEGKVRLLGASIGGDLDCVGGKFHNAGGDALSADRLTTKGAVHLSEHFSAKGQVRLLGASIGGDLDCTGGKFHNPGGNALSVDGLTTRGDVMLWNGFSAEGEVRLLGANIGGNLDCAGGKFNNPDGKAFHADGLTTRGNVTLWNGFSAKGEVRLLGVNIGGNLSCAGGKFNNPDGKALSADGLTTQGGVNLRKGFSAEGEVRLLGANIGGNLSCVNGKFHNLDGNALIADRLTTKGDVMFRGGFSAKGQVRLLGASIGGDLDCTGGKFHNPGGNALSVDGLTTKGDVNLNRDFSAEGEVRLPGGNIGGNLSCAGGKFHNPKRCALNVDGGNINGVLFWRKTTCAGGVNLAFAKIDVLADDSNSWQSCKVVLDGFTYNRFADPVDAQSCIDWMAKRPDGMKFSPQPYEQAAKVLFGMGCPADARKVLLKKERLQTADKRTTQPRKFLRWSWDILAGYGYRFSYTLGWMAFFVILGGAFFWSAAHHDEIVPHQPAILASEKYQTELKGNSPMEAVRWAFPDEYPEFNPLMFSLDVFIPFFALHQEPFWAPASSDGDNFWILLFLLALSLVLLGFVMFFVWLFQHWRRGREDGASVATVVMAVVLLEFVVVAATGAAHILFDAESVLWLADWRWLTVWYWLEIMAGWVLTSLFLLSITGLLRPRQSSGEKD